MMVRRQVRGRRGAAVVEFAVCFAFLLLPIFLGLWEMGRVIEAKQVAQNACREAARQAATGARSISEIETYFFNYLTRNGITTTGVTMTYANVTHPGITDPREAEQLDVLQVTATVPYNNLNTATGIKKLVGVEKISVAAQWCSMRDHPFTIDPNIPIE